MLPRKSVGMFIFLVLGGLLAMADVAHAYLTPGVINYAVQIILAFSIGGVLSIRVFWNRLHGLYQKFFSAKGEGNEEDPTTAKRNS